MGLRSRSTNSRELLRRENQIVNLQKLFEMQVKLDADITAHHPVQESENRLSKKLLALLVEIGETANEWRGFKFWSNDQKPRTESEIVCESCRALGYIADCDELGDCAKCNNTGQITRNPLLEEYVDCLHFILSIGNELEIENIVAIEQLLKFESYENRKVQFVFEKLYLEVSLMLDDTKSVAIEYYPYAFQWFLELGWLLGFTWQQIEQAYYEKNKTNFERQKNGY